MTDAVVFDHVGKVFPTRDSSFAALDDISFSVPEGSVTGVVGTSGAGKSTLIRMVNGLETPSSGTVTVHGQQPGSLSTSELRELRRKVAMVFQSVNLLETKTVAENVATPLKLTKTPKSEIERRTAEVATRTPLRDVAKTRVITPRDI